MAQTLLIRNCCVILCMENKCLQESGFRYFVKLDRPMFRLSMDVNDICHLHRQLKRSQSEIGPVDIFSLDRDNFLALFNNDTTMTMATKLTGRTNTAPKTHVCLLCQLPQRNDVNQLYGRVVKIS